MDDKIFGLLVILFIICFAFSIVIRRYPTFKKWVGWVVNTICKQFLRALRWAWRNYRQAIIGFGVGVFVTLYATGRL
jgi:hypothetical protein